MIYLTRLDGKQFLLNAELIREVESTPDTIVTLSTGQKMVVSESVEDVRRAVLEYKRVAAGGALPEQGGPS